MGVTGRTGRPPALHPPPSAGAARPGRQHRHAGVVDRDGKMIRARGSPPRADRRGPLAPAAARGRAATKQEGAPLKVAAVAMETSSHALHQGRLVAVRFDAALFTNLTRDHLDYHQTMDEYRAAKLRILELLKPAGAVVLNADDPAWNGVGASGNRRVVRFSTSAPADVWARDVKVGEGGMELVLETSGGSSPVHLPLFGDFNVSNAVGCAAVLWRSAPLEEIAEGLSTLTQFPASGARADPARVGHGADRLRTPPTRWSGRSPPSSRWLKGRLWCCSAPAATATREAPGDGAHRRRGRRRVGGHRQPAASRDPGAPRRHRARHGKCTPPPRSDAARPPPRPPERFSRRPILLAGKGHETVQILARERPFDERKVVREGLSRRRRCRRRWWLSGFRWTGDEVERALERGPEGKAAVEFTGCRRTRGRSAPGSLFVALKASASTRTTTCGPLRAGAAAAVVSAHPRGRAGGPPLLHGGRHAARPRPAGAAPAAARSAAKVVAVAPGATGRRPPRTCSAPRSRRAFACTRPRGT